MGKTDRDEAIVQNLLDADCDKEMIERYFALDAEGNTASQMNLLCRHRQALLAKVHEKQRRLDCLDFLIYQKKKEQC